MDKLAKVENNSTMNKLSANTKLKQRSLPIVAIDASLGWLEGSS